MAQSGGNSRSEVEAMEELAKQMWERYFKQKVVSDLLNHSLDGYKAEVISNNGNGTLTVRRPFDDVSMTLKCPPALATSAQAGDQVLVVTLGDMSNAFILCKTDLTGLGGGGGEVLRPSEYDFSDIDANDTFTETVGSGETAVTTTYEVTRDNSGRINKITNLDDGWETDVDWGAAEPPGIPAAEVTYDNTSSGLSATDVQDAIDELAQGGGGGGPSPATNTPLMDGTGAVGTSLKYAREDHEHPTDTSRASATGLSNHVGDTNNPHQVTAAQTGAVPTSRKINGYDLGADRTLTASDVGAQPTITASGILKGDGAGGVSAAVAGTDYAIPSAIPSAYSSNPEMDGTASPGSGTDYALGNHVHPTDTSRLAADGTAVAANRLAIAHRFNGSAGWYAFFSRAISALGGSVDITLLIEDSYNTAVGILRIYMNRNSAGNLVNSYVSWLAFVRWAPDDVRWLYDSNTGVVTIYINKISNNSGRLVFKVLSAVNRNGEDIDLTDNWLSTAVSEPTTATVALQSQKPAVGSVTLTTSWSGTGPYTQTVTVTGPPVTANSKVDLQPTAAQIADLISAGVTGLTVENNAGVLTAYAVGATPSAAMTVQCTVEETV